MTIIDSNLRVVASKQLAEQILDEIDIEDVNEEEAAKQIKENTIDTKKNADRRGIGTND